MKNIILMALAAVLAFVSCVEEISSPEMVSSELYAQMEQEDQTRTMMDENNNIRWSEGDQILAFMKTSLGLKYQIKDEYVGKTSGYFSQVASGSSSDLGAGMEWDHNVVYYPYSSDVECEIQSSNYSLDVLLPVEQVYAPESFGNGYFPMVAVSESNIITFRNVLGGVKLQLKGTGTITSIRIEGKNNESLSGKATVTAYADGTVPSIQMASDASTSVTLDCGKGVRLDETSVTEFIISLPPVVFTNGFIVTVTDAVGGTQTIETSKENEVFRSSLLKMPEVEVALESKPDIPNNQIHYTATEKVEFEASSFEQEVVSHEYDSETQQGVITFDGDVTAIGRYAFSSCDEITGIIIPDSVISIESGAFYSCSSLTEIIIPDSVTSIESDAFYSCSSLTEIIIPDSVTCINNVAFGNCESLEDVTIEGNPQIYYNPFSDCASLKRFSGPMASEDGRCLISVIDEDYYYDYCYIDYSLVGSLRLVAVATSGLSEFEIPEGIRVIGSSCFTGSLENITIPNTVLVIEYGAFRNCYSLDELVIPESVLYIVGGAFPSSMRRLIIKSYSLNWDGYHGFDQLEYFVSYGYFDGIVDLFRGLRHQPEVFSCPGVSCVDRFLLRGGVLIAVCDIHGYNEVLNIPYEVVSIGTHAFYDTHIAEITIPNSVTSIQSGAFTQVQELKNITIPSSVTSFGEGQPIFSRCYDLEEITIEGDYPDWTWGCLWEDCWNLRKINGPMASADGRCLISGNTLIAVAGADLEELVIPDGVVTIEEWAVEDLDNLTRVVIPNTVQSIGDFAFFNCNSLVEVTIPSSVTKIGFSAFDGQSLASVYVENPTPFTIDSSFDGASEMVIYVPQGSVDAYKSHPDWAEYADLIQGYDFE